MLLSNHQIEYNLIDHFYASVPQEQNIHRTCESARNKSPRPQNLTIDTKDLQELNPYTFTQTDNRPIEESIESEEEYQERFMKKASRLKFLYNDDDESSEETPTAELPAQNSSLKPPTVVKNNSELAVSSLYSDEKLERKLKAEKKFRLVMFGDEGDSIEEAYNVAYDGMFEFDLKTTSKVIQHLTGIFQQNSLETTSFITNRRLNLYFFYTYLMFLQMYLRQILSNMIYQQIFQLKF